MSKFHDYEPIPNNPPVLQDAPPVIYSSIEERTSALCSQLIISVSSRNYDNIQQIIEDLTQPNPKDSKNSRLCSIPAMSKVDILQTIKIDGQSLLHQVAAIDAGQIMDLFLYGLTQEEKISLFSQKNLSDQTPLEVALLRGEALEVMAQPRLAEKESHEETERRNTLAGTVKQNLHIVGTLLEYVPNKAELLSKVCSTEQLTNITEAIRGENAEECAALCKGFPLPLYITLLAETLPGATDSLFKIAAGTRNTALVSELIAPLSPEATSTLFQQIPVADRIFLLSDQTIQEHVLLPAIRNDDAATVGGLLAGFSAAATRSLLSTSDSQGTTLLHMAAEHNAISVLAVLLQPLQGKNLPDVLNQVDLRGYTPLHVAAEFGNTQIASALLDKGASAAIRCQELCGKYSLLFGTKGGTAANIATKEGHHELAFTLQNAKNMEKGHRPIEQGKWTQAISNNASDSLTSNGKSGDGGGQIGR